MQGIQLFTAESLLFFVYAAHFTPRPFYAGVLNVFGVD